MYEALAKLGDETLNPAADGRFMDAKHSGDFKQALTIEKVGREHEAVLWRQGLQAAAYGIREAAKLCGRW